MLTERRVVVGVDGSTGARRALRWAMAHAAGTSITVQVVTAFVGEDGALEWSSDYIGSNRHRTDAEQRDAVARVLAEFDQPPTVVRTVVEGRPISVLVDAARKADLLVLGSHGHSHLHAALLGSVTEGCIRAATCPVVVVPAAARAPAQGVDPLASP